MIITFAFDVKNYVEVMEGWPIEMGNTIFSLEYEGKIVRKICISYSKVGIEHAPKFIPPTEHEPLPRLHIETKNYATLAISQIMSWQAVVSGLQVFSLDFDNYEIRFHPETLDEEDKIHVKSFQSTSDAALNATCDFEQIGRAFCVGIIDDTRIESVSHFREGRIAHLAGRYVDAYNNMFLFLETRYCDGKTANQQQVEMLSRSAVFCKNLEQAVAEFPAEDRSKHLEATFDNSRSLKEKIQSVVLLRGKLRHHSLKSPHRWDPNKQSEYETAARFLGLVVAGIVTDESINDIYSPDALQKFRDISVSTGHETRIKVLTRRLEKQRSLVLEMGYPTTVVSSKLCTSIIRDALNACEEHAQLADTVRLDALHIRNELEIFTIELGTWSYTKDRFVGLKKSSNYIRCKFEHFQSGIVVKHEFNTNISIPRIDIVSAWGLFKLCLEWIDKKDPTTRILSLKLFLNEGANPILSYRVGAQVNS